MVKLGRSSKPPKLKNVKSVINKQILKLFLNFLVYFAKNKVDFGILSSFEKKYDISDSSNETLLYIGRNQTENGPFISYLLA